MSGKIKGITVEIGGDTTPLQKAMSAADKQSRSLQTELTKVNKLLKFDPKDTELVAQKQEILAKSISSTKDKLDILRQAQEKVNKAHEANAEWEKEYTPLKAQIDETREKLKNLTEQQDSMKASFASGEISAAQYDKFQKTLNDTTVKSKELAKAEKALEQQFNDGHISDEQYRDFQRQVATTEQKLKSLQYESEQTNSKLLAVGKSINTAGTSLEKAGNKIESTGKTLTTGLTTSILATGTAAVAAFDAVDEGSDRAAAKTGATGDAAQKLDAVYKNVAGNINADFTDIGEAVGEVSIRLGFTGDKLESASEDFLKFARINKIDATQSVQLVSRAMGDAGIKASDYNIVLDELTAASQASGIGIEALATDVTQFGAPMRALGFDTKESISLFSAWEKAGVNTDIAFSGMKKAIGTWGKANKDPREEFKKTLTEIQKCPNIAAATTKAIAVFGQKAGPDLADAIKGGRFQYQDFLKVLDNSKDTVKNSYSTIIDGVDDAKVATQKAKIVLSDFGNQILTSSAPIIAEFSNNVSGLSKKFGNLTDEQKDTIIKTLALTAAAGPAINIVGKLTGGVGEVFKTTGKAITGVKDFTTGLRGIAPVAGEAVSGATELGTDLAALGGAGVLGPLAAVAAAVGLITVAVVKSKNPTDDLINSINKERTSWEELKKTSDDKAGSDLALIGRTQDLWKEMQTVVDKNGKIKTGYEDRVKFITGELNSALGTEITVNGNVVTSYDKISKSIDNIIEKKRAQILLDAHEEDYKKALEEYQKKEAEQTKLEIDLQNKKNDAAAKAAKAESVMHDKTKDHLAAEQAHRDSVQANEDLKKSETAYNNNESLLRDYYKTIGDYESASTASTQGNYAQVEKTLSSVAVAYTVATGATKAQLEQQALNANVAFIQMRQRLAEHATGVTQDMVNKARTAAETANNEFLKVGNEAGQGIIIGIDSQGQLIYQSGAKAGLHVTDGAKSVDYAKYGAIAAGQISVGLDSQGQLVYKSGERAGLLVCDGTKSLDYVSYGQSAGSAFANSVVAVGGGAAAGLKAALDSVDYASSGKKAGNAYGSALSSAIRSTKLPSLITSGALAGIIAGTTAMQWHAAGAYFTKPTIAGVAGGALQGFGEAGPEAALPLTDSVFEKIGEGILKNLKLPELDPIKRLPVFTQKSVTTIDNSKAPVININGPVNLESKGIQDATLQQLQFMAQL